FFLMYLLKQSLLSSLLCWQVCFGHAQTDSVYHPVDTLQTVAEAVARRNYAFRPVEAPKQLLEQFLADIQLRSIDHVQMLLSMRDAAPEPDGRQGLIKSERPTWVLLAVFTLFLAIAVVRLLFPGDFTRIVQAYFDERTLQQV